MEKAALGDGKKGGEEQTGARGRSLAGEGGRSNRLTERAARQLAIKKIGNASSGVNTLSAESAAKSNGKA